MNLSLLSSADFATMMASAGLAWAIVIFLGAVNAVPEAAKSHSLLRHFRGHIKKSGVFNIVWLVGVYFCSLKLSEPKKTWIQTTLFEATRKRLELCVFYDPGSQGWTDHAPEALREINPQIEVKNAKHVANAENKILGYFEAVNTRVGFWDVMGGTVTCVIAGTTLLALLTLLILSVGLAIDLAIAGTPISWPIIVSLATKLGKFTALIFGALAAGIVAAILIGFSDWLRKRIKWLRKTKEPPIETFLTRLQVKDAFIAPLHLIAGLLHRVDEEWGAIITAYNSDTLTVPNASAAVRTALVELRTIQKSTFDCWLLWGPSIPICDTTCGGGGMLSIQLGYGDENSSIEIIAYNDWMDEKIKDLSKAKLGHELAMNVEASGWLSHTKHRPPLNVAAGIKQLWKADTNGRTLLLMDSKDGQKGTITSTSERHYYYTAYLWVVFVIEHRPGKDWCPVHKPTTKSDSNEEQDQMQGKPWLDFLPFFEHGNIGDHKTYPFLQHQLADKALEGLSRLVKGWKESLVQKAKDGKAESPQLYPLRFSYACAIDDAGCGRGNRFAQKADGSIRKLLQTLLNERLHNEKLINDALRLKAKLQNEELPNQMRLNEKDLEETLSESLLNDYEQLAEIVVFSEDSANQYPHAACKMPKMIRAFYDHVAQEKEETK